MPVRPSHYTYRPYTQLEHVSVPFYKRAGTYQGTSIQQDTQAFVIAIKKIIYTGKNANVLLKPWADAMGARRR
jgi:hypothetical protein